MLCMIQHIVVEDAVRDSIYEGAYTNARTNLKKEYKQVKSIKGSDGKELPPDKSTPPQYMVPDENGVFPGLMPPVG